MLPHLDGERTPNRPDARGQFVGITHSNFTRENIARSAIEGVVAGMVYAWRAVEKLGVKRERILLVGGAARNAAVQQIAASMFGSEIIVPEPGEYVADGAAKQAAWALLGTSQPPQWQMEKALIVEPQLNKVIDATVNSYLELISAI
jgi:xylulokinase